MGDLKVNSCPTCGATLIKTGLNSFTCEYCGNRVFLDVVNNEMFSNRISEAYSCLKQYKYDEADNLYLDLYKEATNTDDNLKATCLWGRLLSSYGVTYISSYKTGLTVPTFTKYSRDLPKITECDYYKEILKLDITNNEKNSYIESAEKLDDLFSQIGIDLKSSPTYDFFICSKISAAYEGQANIDGFAADRDYALKLYEDLKNKGFDVFLSCKTLDKVENDTAIYTALAKSKNIIVVSTKKEYLESAWVMSEWRRWIQFINIKEKGDKSLYLYIPNFKTNPFNLPQALNKQVYSSDDYDDLLDTLIKNNSKLKKRSIETIASNPTGMGENQLVDAAWKYLKNKRFDSAIKLCEEVLEKNKSSVKALEIEFLGTNEISTFDEWIKTNSITKNIDILEKLLAYECEENRVQIFDNVYYKLLTNISDYDLLEFYVLVKGYEDEQKYLNLLNVAVQTLAREQVELLSMAIKELNYNKHQVYFSKFLIDREVNNYIDLIDCYDIGDESIRKARDAYCVEFPDASNNIYLELDINICEVKDLSFEGVNKEDFYIDINNVDFDISKLKMLVDEFNINKEKSARKKELDKLKNDKKTEKIEKTKERWDNFKTFVKENPNEILLASAIVMVVLGCALVWFKLLWFIAPSFIVLGYLLYSVSRFYEFFTIREQNYYIKKWYFAINLVSLISVFIDILFACWYYNNYFPLLISSLGILLVVFMVIAIRTSLKNDNFRYIRKKESFLFILSNYLLALSLAAYIVGVITSIYYMFTGIDVRWLFFYSLGVCFGMPWIHVLSFKLYQEELKAWKFLWMVFIILSYIAFFVCVITSWNLGYIIDSSDSIGSLWMVLINCPILLVGAIYTMFVIEKRKREE